MTLVNRWLAQPVQVPYPWTPFLGLVRSLLAFGTLATLVATPTDNLFRPVLGIGDYPTCEGFQSIGLFCVVPEGRLGAAQVVACAILMWVISGHRPALTAPLHWWVSYSVFTGIAIADGGDQLTAVLTLLLMGILVFDPRRNHWRRAPIGEAASPPQPTILGLAAVCLFAAKLQMSLLYLDAAISKLPHEEWHNGTYMWYAVNGMFGPGEPIDAFLAPIVATPVGVVAITWAPIAIELLLGVTCLTARRWRAPLLALGMTLHFAIAVVMGLWSFMFAMFAGLLLLTVPLDASAFSDRFRLERPLRPRTVATFMQGGDHGSAPSRSTSRRRVTAVR